MTKPEVDFIPGPPPTELQITDLVVGDSILELVADLGKLRLGVASLVVAQVVEAEVRRPKRDQSSGEARGLEQRFGLEDPSVGHGRIAEQAAARGLAVADKPDSHDICFIADGDNAGWLRDKLGPKPGTIVDESGETLREHDGAYAFTVGQRRGRAELGVLAEA